MAKQGSVALKTYDNDLADVIAGFGDACRIVPGNSGSPAFNEDGNVAAVVFATGKDGLTDNLNRQARKMGVGGMHENIHLGLFSSYACVSFPSGVNAFPSVRACDPQTRQSLQQSAAKRNDARLAAPIQADEQAGLSALRQFGPRPFEYVLSDQNVKTTSADANSKAQSFTFDVSLGCLKSRDQWPEGSYRLDSTNELMTVEYIVPTYQYGLFLDSFARIETRRVSEAMRKISLSIDLTKVTTVDSVVGVQWSSESFGSTPVVTHWCR